MSSKYFIEYIRLFRHIPPASSGKDGYTVCYRQGDVFIPNQIIDKATDYADSIRTGFILGEYCYSLSPGEISEIRQREFEEMLFLLIENGYVKGDQ